MHKQLSCILENTTIKRYHELNTYSHIYISKICNDSRLVEKDSLFFAINGHSENGEKYIQDALTKGARVIVTSQNCTTLIPSSHIHLKSDMIRKDLSQCSANFYDHPSKDLVTIGITGTNGKTTVSHIIESIFLAEGIATGVIGTLGSRMNQDAYEPIKNTTPDPIKTHELLSKFKKKHTKVAIIEVSSHGLMMHRMDNIHFDACIFTNLTEDHLDYHNSLEEYFKAKSILFNSLLPKSKKDNRVAIINIDNLYGKKLYDAINNNVNCIPISTHSKNKNSPIRLNSIMRSKNGTNATIQIYDQEISFCSSLILGTYNIENILCAIATCHHLGTPNHSIKKGIESYSGVPGRLGLVKNNKGYTIFVDFAHTPDALHSVLSTLKPICPGKLVLVFGCGGDRDTSKRPIMAKVAERLSDYIIITSDNPRNEQPDKIISDIVSGFSHITNYTQIIDRRSAIEKAIAISDPKKDWIIVAGKGHESNQIIHNTSIPWNDTNAIEALLDSLMEAK